MEEIFNRVAFQMGMSPETIETIYKAYWKFVKKHIEALPLKEGLNKEEFDKLRTSFNITQLGKFYVDYDKYKKLLESYKNNKEC